MGHVKRGILYWVIILVAQAISLTLHVKMSLMDTEYKQEFTALIVVGTFCMIFSVWILLGYIGELIHRD